MLVVLSLAGCGRLTVAGPMPTEPVALAEAPPPPAAAHPLTKQETAARPLLGRHREAPLALLTVGPVTPDGQLANTMRAGWEFGFWVPGTDRHTYRTVRIDPLGRGELRSAFGETAAPPPGLVLAELPAPSEAIAQARTAGLAAARRYEIDYLATPQGPIVRVSGGKTRLTLNPKTGETVQEAIAQAAFRPFGR